MFPMPLTAKTSSIAINYLHIMGIKQNGDILASGGIKLSPLAQISKEKVDFGKQLNEIKKELKTDMSTIKGWSNVSSIAAG